MQYVPSSFVVAMTLFEPQDELSWQVRTVPLAPQSLTQESAPGGTGLGTGGGTGTGRQRASKTEHIKKENMFVYYSLYLRSIWAPETLPQFAPERIFVSAEALCP